MAKKKIIRRNNRPLTYRMPSTSKPDWNTNQYSIGGFLSGQSGKVGGIMGGSKIAGSPMGGAISSIGGAVGQIGGSLIGGGLESGAGSAISNIGGTIGGAIGAVNPVLGGIISAGTGIVGGLTNRAFGSKLNQEKINEVNASNTAVNQVQVDSSSNDALTKQWGTMDLGKDFSQKDIGEDGWFSSKAADKYKELKRQQDTARNRAMLAFENGADTADTNQDLSALRNFSAFGGPINIISNTPMTPFGNRFDNGGSIHINPANRGKFNATKQRTGKSTEELTHSKNALTRKRAIFAQNASHWHALGGVLQGDGADWSTGMTPINNGGTHEQNPNEGVQMGVDDQGTPNLVEQGEVKWNDYIFSNRMVANRSLLDQANLPSSLVDHTFASAAENLGKEAKERPNDPISQRGLNDSLTKLAMAQEALRQKQQQRNMKKRKYSCGGHLFADGGFELPFIKRANGTYPIDDSRPDIGTYGKDWGLIEQNPYTPEEGEYPLQPPASKQTFIYPFSKAAASSTQRTTAVPQGTNNTKGPIVDGSSLRYAPVIGSGLAVLSDALGWINKPDYTNADRIQDSVSHIQPVTYTPIGNYLAYNPFDMNFYSNKLEAQAGATRRAIANQSGGNRANAVAGMLAADYNAQGKLGDLFRQAEEYNQGLRERVENFNRSTDQFNSEQSMKSQIANQATDRLRFEAAAQAARLRDEVDSRSAAAKSANLSNFFNNIGAVGQESFSRNMVKSNPGLYYSIDSNGNITYKPKENKKACGGLLTIKKKGRRK